MICSAIDTDATVIRMNPTIINLVEVTHSLASIRSIIV